MKNKFFAGIAALLMILSTGISVSAQYPYQDFKEDDKDNTNPIFLKADRDPIFLEAKQNTDFLKVETKYRKHPGFFTNKQVHYSEIATLFQKVANNLKHDGCYTSAGIAFTRAAQCWTRAKLPSEAVNNYVKAFECFSKCPETMNEATASINQAISYYTDNCKFSNAARLLGELGKVQREKKDYDRALTSFKKAAQIHKNENQYIQAANILEDIAELQSQQAAQEGVQQKWLDAGNTYNEIVDIRLRDRLTQTLAGNYAMKAILCFLAGGEEVRADRCIQSVISASPSWQRSREYALCDSIVKAVKENDADAVSTASAEYNIIRALDKWMVDVLFTIKQKLETSVEDNLEELLV